jgi:hypothetical protein
MKSGLVGAALALLLVAGCSAPAPDVTSAQRETTITRTAVVEGIDRKTRQVDLRLDDGSMTSVVAGPEVRNFAQLATGDKVVVAYHESVAASMADASDSGEATGAVMAERAPEGEKPGAMVGAGVRMVVEFVSYDPETSMVTIINPDGETESIEIRPEMREFAASRKPGDRVAVEIIRAVAVSIDET